MNEWILCCKASTQTICLLRVEIVHGLRQTDECLPVHRYLIDHIDPEERRHIQLTTAMQTQTPGRSLYQIDQFLCNCRPSKSAKSLQSESHAIESQVYGIEHQRRLHQDASQLHEKAACIYSTDLCM